MIQYIMFNGHKYIPTSELTEKEQGHCLLIVGSADGLHFCKTGMTRFYMVDESAVLKSLLS